MLIRLELDAADPPEGCAVGDDETSVTFAGWLGLMQAVAEVAARAAETARAALAEKPERS